MESPNLVIVEVTESPKVESEARSKQDEQQQQQQQQQEEEQQKEEKEIEAAEKSVVSSTKPELEELPQMQMEAERLPVIADSNKSACYGCKMPFVSNYSELVLMPPDLQWHHNCFTCSACGTNLGDSKQCHFKDGKPYCTDDYVRQFGVQCEGCQQWITNGDALVHNINGKTFHASCLCCNKCNSKFKTGDSFMFSEEDSALLCSSDYQYWMQPAPSPSCAPGMFNMPPAVYAQTPAVGMPKGQPLSVIQRRPGVNNRSRQRQREKKPRERTVYTDWQMNKLISYYEKNPRPTTQEKEAYAEELSVPKKKVSVWFQNRRCKDKKKQEIEERLEIAVQQDQRREEEKAQANQQPPFLPANLTPHLPQKEYNENEHHSQLGTGPIEMFSVPVDMPWAPVPPTPSIPPTHAMLPTPHHHYFGPTAFPPMMPEVQYNFAARGFLPALSHAASPHPAQQPYSPNEYSHNHNSPPDANSPESPYMVSPTDAPVQQHHPQSPRNTYTLNPTMYPHIQHTNSPSLASPPHTTTYSGMDLMQQAQYTFHLNHDGPY